jgi:hypothetical protein
MQYVLVHDLIIKNAVVVIKNKKAESNYMVADKFKNLAWVMCQRFSNFPIVA